MEHTEVKPVEENKANSLAITSVLLGFLSGIFAFFTAIPAVICGHMVLSRIKNDPSGFSPTDKRLAIGGLFFGYLAIVAWLYLVFLGLAIYFELDLRGLFPYGMRT